MPVNSFDSDTHRRVAANLSVPMSAGQLAAQLARHDPYVEADAYTAEGVSEYLADLEADGLVKQLKSLGDAKKAVAAIADDPDVPTIQREKAASFCRRAEIDPDAPLWIMTTATLDRLNGHSEGTAEALAEQAAETDEGGEAK